MTKKRQTVIIPGDNSYDAEDMIEVLQRVPAWAKIRSMNKIGKDPDIVIWWEDEL